MNPISFRRWLPVIYRVTPTAHHGRTRRGTLVRMHFSG